MKTITPAAAALLIHAAGDTIFSATFLKKDSTLRSGRFRLGSTMTKGKNGKGMAFNPNELGLVVVFDLDRDGYRMINLATLRKLQVRGVAYSVAPAGAALPS